MSFWGELRRRNVFKVGATYLIVAWLIAQIVSVLNDPLSLPDRFDTIVIVLLAIGFPVAVILAWAYEITPQGLKPASEVVESASIRRVTNERLNYVITGLVVVVLGFVVVDQYLIEGSAGVMDSQETSIPSAERATETPASVEQRPIPNRVAVLPFENLSADPENAFFAAGIHDEILNRLMRIGNLDVISRTSVMQFEDSGLPIPEIAAELNVDAVMEGRVRYANDRVRITAQLIDAVTDEDLWSNVYERDFADIFAIQADIATNIAIALEATFTLAEQESIERRPTDSLEAYELYLLSKAQSVATVEDFVNSMELVERALELDPEFALAWAWKASLHHQSRFQSLDPRDAADIHADAEYAALRAVELDPDSGVAHSALANTYWWNGDWITAEAEYREALAVGGEPGDYAFFLLAVGKAERARDYYFAAKELDPLNDVFAMFIAASYDSSGDARRALEEYDRIAWGGTIVNQIITQLGTDDDLALIPQWGIEGRVYDNRDAPELALAELRELYEQVSRPIDYVIISALAARFGDEEFSLRVMEDAFDWMPPQSYMIWRPVFRDVRALPRFRDVMSDRGFETYWREYGWPAFCQPLTDEDFECE